MAKFLDLKNGIVSKDYVYCVIRGLEEKDSRGGKFVVFNLFDGKTEIQARKWSTELSSLRVKQDDVVKALVEASLYQGNMTYVLLTIEKTSEYTEADFMPKAPISSEEMYNYIFGLLQDIKNDTLRYISTKLYTDYRNELYIWPAAKKMHHDIYAGLLYHTYRMIKSAENIASNVYGSVDRDVVIAGIALHDIGKLFEMKPTKTGNGEYTLDGTLFGHLYLGMRIIENTARSCPNLDKNALKHLLHIIASHHGKLEYGALVIPKTKEAFMVSEIDMLDSKYYMYESGEDTLNNGEFTSDYVKL